MKLKNFGEFLSEDSDSIKSIKRAKEKLDKTADKTDRFDTKTRAAQMELDLRKQRLKFEEEKDRIKREIETADNEAKKGAAKDKLYALKIDWKESKQKLLKNIKALRNYTK